MGIGSDARGVVRKPGVVVDASVSTGVLGRKRLHGDLSLRPRFLPCKYLHCVDVHERTSLSSDQLCVIVTDIVKMKKNKC